MTSLRTKRYGILLAGSGIQPRSGFQRAGDRVISVFSYGLGVPIIMPLW